MINSEIYRMIQGLKDRVETSDLTIVETNILRGIVLTLDVIFAKIRVLEGIHLDE